MARAAACVQSAPENSELYHNPDFAKKLSITFKNTGEDVGLLAKLYSEDGELASTVYIAPGKKVKIRLPRGQYTLNLAWGSRWFGEKEYFGRDAFYGTDPDPFKISSGYYYIYEMPTPAADDIWKGTLTFEEF
jgi:hypothetical protein